MKLLSLNLIRLGVAGLLLLSAGCRPTIEFQSDFTSVERGGEVTLEWDIELAKGTSRSKVTLSDLGEVDLQGSETITLEESEDITLRVSTFVLGMPIVARETIAIEVYEDNFVSWDFEQGSDNGWSKAYVFYGNDKEADALCRIDEHGIDSFATGAVLPEVENLGSSLQMCFQSDEDAFHEDDQEQELLALVYRKVTKADGFELDDNTYYNVGFSVKYGVNFNTQAVCDKVAQDLDSRFEIVVGASKEKPLIDSNGDSVTLNLAEFDQDGDNHLNYKDGVSANEFNQLAGKSFASFLKIDPITAFNTADIDVSQQHQDYARKKCEANSPYVATFTNMQQKDIVHETNEDGELYLMVGLKSGLLEAGSDDIGEDEVEFYVDTIKVLIEEKE